MLLTNSGATLGVPKITMLDGCINDGSVAFFNIINNTLLNYLYWFLKSQTGLLRKISQGAGQPNLNTQIVKNILIPLPAFEEQIQIVNKLESSFTLIEHLEESLSTGLQKAYAFKQAMLRKAFKGELVPQIANDEPAAELLSRISSEKDAFLNARIEAVKKKPKRRRTMENNKSILEILKDTDTPIDAKDLWQKSMHKDDIEAFYAELKELMDKISVVTTGKKTQIELDK